MAEHEITANFEVNAAAVAGQQAAAAAMAAAAADMVRRQVTDRMADAVLGGKLGANPEHDALARAKAADTYVMVLAMLAGLSAFGILDFKVTA